MKSDRVVTSSAGIGVMVVIKMCGDLKSNFVKGVGFRV